MPRGRKNSEKEKERQVKETRRCWDRAVTRKISTSMLMLRQRCSQLSCQQSTFDWTGVKRRWEAEAKTEKCASLAVLANSRSSLDQAECRRISFISSHFNHISVAAQLCSKCSNVGLSVNLLLGPNWNISTVIRLWHSSVQTFMFPRGWILLTLNFYCISTTIGWNPRKHLFVSRWCAAVITN